MGTAAFIHAAGDIRIGPFTPEHAGSTSVMVRVASVGVCGSDLHYYKDGGIGSAVIDKPFVPGHEFSATLTADVEQANLQRNQVVAIDPALPCHSCEWCTRGYHNLCPHVVFLGAPPYNGALTQEIAVPLQSIIPLPDSMTADQGAMLEPLGVCIHAIDLAKPRLLETVAVVGCGAIGLGIIQLLKLTGCGQVYAIDPQPHRYRAAQKYGSETFAVTGGDSIDLINDETQGRGCDLVIEATNSADGLAHAVKATRIGGRAVLVGIPDGDLYSPLSAAEARRRGLSLKFSRRMGNVYPRAIDLVAANRVNVDSLVSHRFSLEDTAQAFSMQARSTEGLLKSLIYPNGV